MFAPYDSFNLRPNKSSAVAIENFIHKTEYAQSRDTWNFIDANRNTIISIQYFNKFLLRLSRIHRNGSLIIILYWIRTSKFTCFFFHKNRKQIKIQSMLFNKFMSIAHLIATPKSLHIVHIVTVILLSVILFVRVVCFFPLAVVHEVILLFFISLLFCYCYCQWLHAIWIICHLSH